MISNIIRRLFITNGDPLISFKQLQDTYNFSWTELYDNIKIMQLPVSPSNQLCFKTIMLEGANFKRHYHDFTEYIHVIKGRVKIMGKEYTYGMTKIVYPDTLHDIQAIEDSELFVECYKNK